LPPLVFLQTRKLTRVMIAISPRVPDSILFWLKECAKSFSGSGFARDRTGAGGAHSAVPDTVADKGGGGEGERREGRKEMRGKVGKGRERKGGCLLLNSGLLTPSLTTLHTVPCFGPSSNRNRPQTSGTFLLKMFKYCQYSVS